MTPLPLPCLLKYPDVEGSMSTESTQGWAFSQVLCYLPQHLLTQTWRTVGVQPTCVEWTGQPLGPDALQSASLCKAGEAR